MTTQINITRRKAMKAAWTNFKSKRYDSFSESLKSAWAWVKSLGSEFKEVTCEVLRETEKAILIELNQITQGFEYGKKLWVPKSVCGHYLGEKFVNGIEIKTWFCKKNNF
jgi:hypothetical protein